MNYFSQINKLILFFFQLSRHYLQKQMFSFNLSLIFLCFAAHLKSLTSPSPTLNYFSRRYGSSRQLSSTSLCSMSSVCVVSNNEVLPLICREKTVASEKAWVVWRFTQGITQIQKNKYGMHSMVSKLQSTEDSYRVKDWW